MPQRNHKNPINLCEPITFLHLPTVAHNRVSGYNFINLTLTASTAMPATWGKPIKPIGINRGAVADPVAVGNNGRR